MPDIISQAKTITLELKEYLDSILGYLDSVPVKRKVAELISIVDSDEQFTHIEFDDWQTGKPLEPFPILWNIKKWMLEDRRRSNLKVRLARQKEIADRQHKNIHNTARCLAIKTKLPEKQCIIIATKMVVEGDSSFLKEIGIDINEVTTEERKEMGTYIVLDERGKERRIM